MAIAIMIPSSGELGSDITLLRWLVRLGEATETGTPLAEVEADKGVLEIEAPGPGTVLALLHAEGDTVAPGAILGYIGQPGEAVPAGPAPAPPGTRERPMQVDGPRAQAEGSAGVAHQKAPSPQAAPATRRLAATLGVRLEAVPPTGAGGIVTKRDVEAWAARAGAAPAGAGSGGAGLALSANQRAVAAQVGRSQREIPPVHFTTRVDARSAVKLRASGIGYTALFVFAAGRTLERFPAFRRRLEGEAVITAEGAHVAFAVSGEGGELYTPVLRNAGSLDLAAVHTQVRELTQAARGRRLGPEAFTGGCFLVTNLGMFPIESFDPLIYPGHSGALAVGAIQMQPTAVERAQEWSVEIHPSLSLTLAVDHRLINGAEAARALACIKELVEGGAK